MSAPRNPDRFHGRMHSSRRQCQHPTCQRAGEFRAPNPYGRPPGPNGPGDYLWFCLDHVREFNAGYDWFEGMSAEEIAKAQSPMNVWPSETRAFRANGNVDSPPRWADFRDPIDAISARFKGRMEDARPATAANGHILSADDKKALKTLGLGHDADRKAMRSAYSRLVRKYHPDKNGGDRAHEKALQDVIAAYTHLKMAPAFA
ncbi:MAG: DnaJ domain-containing protein [Sphingomonadales bacterium]